MNRRQFVYGTVATAAALSAPRLGFAQKHDLAPVWTAIDRRRDATIRQLQDWIRQPTIAAENKATEDGCRLMMELARAAGFQQVSQVPTRGIPGVFATLDAGASRTVALYFMYDVKQGDGEWVSPPFEARILDRPGTGRVLIGRGAVNQKGPQTCVLAAMHAIRDAGRTMPVNLVLVAEGEEEIGSPNFPEIVNTPEVQAALKKCSGVYMPGAMQAADGNVTISLGAKGVIEVELVSSGERWGRGATKDIHSSLKASVDSPVWHLVKALDTLVADDGNTPAIAGFADRARPLSADEKQMIAAAARRQNEALTKKQLGVARWIDDANYQQALEMLMSRPTVNIEGMYAGWTGPGGKTVLPSRAVAKLDLRLVPDMRASEALAALKAHLAKHGFDDIDVTMTGGYDPTSTPKTAMLIRAQEPAYKGFGVDPILMPRSAGSWPGYVFTGEPLKLPATHFGLGHGGG
ncbi:MAG TPA: M20/M25/M40 family metallo-hydrolase, partial [Vicinamibacterales bacterium]|nr:M20/M25/M40 family metallo-hydrolase [Vicinamibacterales bacterium]